MDKDYKLEDLSEEKTENLPHTNARVDTKRPPLAYNDGDETIQEPLPTVSDKVRCSYAATDDNCQDTSTEDDQHRDHNLLAYLDYDGQELAWIIEALTERPDTYMDDIDAAVDTENCNDADGTVESDQASNRTDSTQESETPPYEKDGDSPQQLAIGDDAYSIMEGIYKAKDTMNVQDSEELTIGRLPYKKRMLAIADFYPNGSLFQTPVTVLTYSVWCEFRRGGYL